MKKDHRMTALIAAVAILGFSGSTAYGVTASGVAASSETSQPECPTQAEASDQVLTTVEVSEGVDVVTCDLVGMHIQQSPGSGANDGPGARQEVLGTIEIPPPGQGVEMTTTGLTEADSSEFYVGVTPNGDLEYSSPDDPTVFASLASGACEDEAYNLLRYPMNLNETFNIRVGSFPSYVNEADTRASIVDGIRAWPQLHNDCDMPDNVDATAEDGGGATAPSSVTAAGCEVTGSEGDDSISVFTFGDLPSTVLGRACRHVNYTPQGYIVDGGDVMLNKHDHAWTNRPNRSDCQEYDIQSVVTHEAGHWWGLAHVDADNHPNLTMRDRAGNAFYCNDKMRTLGRGDVLGMRDWY